MKESPAEEKGGCLAFKQGRSEETPQIQARDASFERNKEVSKVN